MDRRKEEKKKMQQHQFQSQRQRLQFIKKFYLEQPYFREFKLSKDCQSLDALIEGTSPDTIIKSVYSRAETNTYVFKFSHPAFSSHIIVKIYMVRKSNSHNAEIQYLFQLAQLILKNKTPHVTLPIGRSIQESSQVKELIGSLCPKLDEGKYQIMLSEYANGGTLTDLLNYEKVGSAQMCLILFQILQTMIAIQSVIPGFRHNDLHTSNILIQAADHPGGYTMYKIGPETYYHDVTLCPYRVLFWDLYFSDVSPTVPEYSDLHKLFDSLHHVIMHRSLGYRTKLKSVLEIIDFVVPDSLKCMHAKKSEKNLDYGHRVHLTSSELLKHDFFRPAASRPLNSKLLEIYTV